MSFAPLSEAVDVVLAPLGGSGLPALIDRASKALAGARTSAEVLEARDLAGLAYDAAKRAARFARAKDAHDRVVAAAHRAQADALEIESGAKRRLADEYDAAQDRGEVASRGGSGANQYTGKVLAKNISAEQPFTCWCGEEFNLKVWHCPNCAHHWHPEDDRCKNCRQPKPGVMLPTSADLGLTRKAVFEARQVRDAEEREPGIVRETLNRLVEAGEEPTRAALNREIVNRTSFTGNNQWFTPAEHIERSRRVLGTIDLDPASHDLAQARVKASTFFTEEQDGLSHPWHGRVWLNPPYAQPEIGYFVDKIVEETAAGRTSAAIMLTHNYTDTAWFQKAARAARCICFTRGRVRFVSPNGDLAAPTQGQAFFYFGEDHEKFAAEFAEIGFVAEVLK